LKEKIKKIKLGRTVLDT